MTEPLFKLNDVSFSYTGNVPALQSVNLSIFQGSRIAIIGENGSGKSTLLKLLDGLYLPNSGNIQFGNNVLTEKLLDTEEFVYDFRRRVALLFQDPETQLFSSSVFEEICFGPLQLKWEQERIREKAHQIMKVFGIDHLANRPPFRLSIGEKKKVALASVLVTDPEVLLLDEPVAALDPRTQNLLLELIHDWSQNGKTIITSTHDLTILKEISDDVYVMQNGKIVYQS
ncbi:MAG TPA: ABC transporter ATP-binding protein, partial [Acidobacteriota bacterium]|nr:ABC transporter ATP-binding protein [Acidobacteriota bacterium]